MTNEIQKVNGQLTGAPSNLPRKAVFMRGEKTVYAEKVDTMNVRIESAYIGPQSLIPVSPPFPIEFDRRFYNLFVSYDVDIRNIPFNIHVRVCAAGRRMAYIERHCLVQTKRFPESVV